VLIIKAFEDQEVDRFADEPRFQGFQVFGEIWKKRRDLLGEHSAETGT
jgi:hypothetical protein